MTRWGDLGEVLAGVTRRSAAGLKIKINTVALKGFNDDEALSLVEWAHGRGFDLTFIEVMPLGAMERDRADQYLPLTELRARLESSLSLTPSAYATGGPARYYDVKETGGRLGFITPLTHNFCESCNRVRVTCTGTLYMCLGQEDAADLREPLRRSTSDAPLLAAIRGGDRAQAQGPRFRHRPLLGAGDRASHEHDRRLSASPFCQALRWRRTPRRAISSGVKTAGP